MIAMVALGLLFSFVVLPYIRDIKSINYHDIYNILDDLPDASDTEEDIGFVYDFLFYLPESEDRSDAINRFEDIFIAYWKYTEAINDIKINLEERFYQEYKDSR